MSPSRKKTAAFTGPPPARVRRMWRDWAIALFDGVTKTSASSPAFTARRATQHSLGSNPIPGHGQADGQTLRLPLVRNLAPQLVPYRCASEHRAKSLAIDWILDP